MSWEREGGRDGTGLTAMSGCNGSGATAPEEQETRKADPPGSAGDN